MDISVLLDYVNVVILGICLCVGFIIKTSLDFINNKYIPLILGLLGLAINIITNLPNITPAVILSGIISGLAATGLYEAFKNLIGDKGDN